MRGRREMEEGAAKVIQRNVCGGGIKGVSNKKKKNLTVLEVFLFTYTVDVVLLPPSFYTTCCRPTVLRPFP